MIFYDSRQVRKYYVRLGALVFLVFFTIVFIHFDRVINTVFPLTFANATTTPSYASSSKKLVLTFDDGPHPTHTPVIMDILEQYDVPATFFFTGLLSAEHPDLLRDVYDRGYLIGVHSYSHRRDVHESRQRLQREILSTNRLIELYTGHRTTLYRPPYLLDLETAQSEVIDTQAKAAGIKPLEHVQELGFITIGAEIDSRDWEVKTSSDLIASVMGDLPNGNIVLLHDGGTDRSLTVETLPYLIEVLQSEGYEFISLSEYIGVSDDELMPSAIRSGGLASMEQILVGGYVNFYTYLVPGLIALLLVLSFVRIFSLLMLLVFGLDPKRQPPWNKGVSILVPAYNEAENITATVHSIAKSNIFPREIIVIDDGSTDKTAEYVETLMLTTDENLKLIKKENGGKSSALNAGLDYTSYEVVVVVDGDTVVHKDAIARLASHFHDPAVGAVAGRIQAIAKSPLLGNYQNLEYTIGQNIDKVALSRINAVGIIPGAIGALRRINILRAGGYNQDTTVEDQDLTFAIHIQGKRVIYEPLAMAYTEVPSSTISFLKQRYRWIYGSLQCLWKYRTHFFSMKNPTFGWILLPYSLTYNFLIPLLWPLILCLLIMALFEGEWSIVFASALIFLLIDSLYCLIGLIIEPGKLHLLLILPLQRLYYRLAVTGVLLVCLVRVLEGSRTYWHKLARTGSAQQYYETNKNNLAFSEPTNPVLSG